MTPEAWSAVSAFLDRFGLPILMLAVLGYLVLKRKLVTGAEAESWKALYERERQDRIAAEQALAKFAPANAEVAEAVADLSRTVLQHLTPRELYDEREGRRGR